MESIVGASMIANKALPNGYIAIYCDETFPITFKYNTKLEFLTLEMDYETYIVDADDPTVFNPYKPGTFYLIN